MTPAGQLLLLIPIAYFLGAVPFGLVVGLARGIDPRKGGSGNIGATNVGRLLGGRYFALVMILDLFKGLLPMLLAAWIVHDDAKTPTLYLLWILVGFATVMGHMFPIYLRFKGGKGVATSAGLILGLFPYYTLPAIGTILTFIIVFFAKRYVSLASIAAAVTFPLWYLGVALARDWEPFTDQLILLIFAIVVGALVVYKHRSNIARLRAGTESPIPRKNAPRPAASS